MIDIKAQGKGILLNSNNQTCFAVTTPQKTKMSSTHILLLNVFFSSFFWVVKLVNIVLTSDLLAEENKG